MVLAKYCHICKKNKCIILLDDCKKFSKKSADTFASTQYFRVECMQMRSQMIHDEIIKEKVANEWRTNHMLSKMMNYREDQNHFAYVYDH